MEYLFMALGALLLFALVWLTKLVFFKPFNINHFFERAMLVFVLGFPEILSSMRIFERMGYHGHNKKLNNMSDAHEAKLEKKVKANLATLRSYDRDKLTSQQQLSYDVLEHYLSDTIEMMEFRHLNYPVNQLFGVQNGYPTFMVTVHQINNIRDAKHYIVRLAKVKTKFAQVLEGLNIREQKGVIPPRFVFDKVLDEMINFIAVPVTENILYTSMAEKLDKIQDLNQGQKEELLAQARAEIEASVYPAYQMLIDYFEVTKDKATKDAGVWKLPDGDKYYQFLLKHYTTTDLSAEEIHNIGLAEVERIQTEMADILAGVGYSGKHPIEHMNDLAQESRFAYPEGDASREQVLKDYQAMIDRVDQNIDHLFDLRPKAKVIVERIPKFKEKTAPGAYYNPPAMDGSRPGVFSANLLKLPRKYDMETLAYHEAIPGHHFQLATQQELKGLPTFRRVLPFTAYAEGWALYTERLAWENNLFSDGYSVLGFLASELFRAVRLVVDTGLHYKRWTREEAIEYMLKNTGSDEVDVTIEVERYIVMPGQATAYMVGQLEMLRLRDLAREQLGEAFDIREFHNIVLKNGSLPLSILGKNIQEFIVRNKPEPDAKIATRTA